MKTIIWEDLNLETNVVTGAIEEIMEDLEDIDEEDLEEIIPEQIVTTPFGICNLRDYFNPMRQYKWNMAHTNFNVSKPMLLTLSKVSGIEKIVPISRYRFLIAFGKAFSITSVKKDIYKALDATQPLSDKVLEKKRDLESLYEKWAIYYLSENDWDSADECSYEEKVKEFRERQINENGIVITHETDI